ncbi:MAG TPA: GDSL-type esterase/lipase family protein [Planctomicrobium sp.]|nr:GDSL-type esterase/lipase family protein [Planctomicrobium sp.]
MFIQLFIVDFHRLPQSGFKTHSLILCCLFGVIVGLPRPACAEHNGKIQVLLLGDSTTEAAVPRQVRPDGPHFEQMIELLLATEKDLPKVHVINSGVSSEYIHLLITSGRYDRDVSKLPGLDYILIRYGLNDRSRRENVTTTFPADYRDLIHRLRNDHPEALIIPMSVIPYTNEPASQQMNQLTRQIAEEERLPFFDLYPLYAAALKNQGINSLNYRRYPVEKIPLQYRELVKPYVRAGRVVVLDNELDSILGHLPDVVWQPSSEPCRI